jgi:hypothetical protein
MRRQVTTTQALAAAALVAAACVVALLAGCGGDDGTAGTTTQARSTPATTTQARSTPATTGGASTTGSATTEPRRPPTPETRQIVVRDGRPVGGVARLEYERGEQVRFIVQSDVADEVHVHGFDLTKDVPANGSVRFEFAAAFEGVFEIELEGAGLEIAELRIRP